MRKDEVELVFNQVIAGVQSELDAAAAQYTIAPAQIAAAKQYAYIATRRFLHELEQRGAFK